MSLTFSTTTTAADRVVADLLAVTVAEGGEFGVGADAVDAALGGGLAAFIEETGFEGKLGETLAVPTAGKLRAKAAVLVGVGDPDELTLDGLRRAGAAISRRVNKVVSLATTLVDAAPALDRVDATQAVAEGLALGAYQFLDYRSDPKPSRLKKVVIMGADGAAVKAAAARGAAIADAVMWARDIINLPSKEKPPAAFAAEARKLLRGKGVSVTVLDVAQMKELKLGGVLGVGQGSDQSPGFLKLTYSPSGTRGKPLVFVGKGVVFDSGGLSLKTGAGMETMKCDMSGGAAVVAAMSALQALGVKTRVYGYVPLVENMPSGHAIRPGDVLRIRNGKTVEVLNTDAEGRLILADALSLASEDQPAAVVDLATLTGACMVALGEKIAGLMGNDDAWIDQVRSAADRVGERVWPLPLPADYRKGIESPIADIKNVGPREGGALTAGLFLQEFVDNVPWAHLDIAGPAFIGADDGYLPKGGTGFGVRTLLELASTFEAPAPMPAKNGGKAGAKSAGKAGAKSAGTTGAKSAGTTGAKSAGTTGAKSAGTTGAKPRGKSAAREAMISVVRVVVAAASTIALATLYLAAIALPVAAQVPVQVPTGDAVVTVQIRDNVFEPASLEVTPGTTVRWVNEGRNRHDVTPDKGRAFRSGKLRPGQSYAHTFEDPGSFAYYCNIHGAPGKGQFADLAVAKQAPAPPVPIGGSDAPVPTFKASGRTIKVPADAKTIQQAVDRTRPGDLVLVSPGVYRESVTVATEGIVVRGVDRNRTILDGEFKRDNGVKVVGADGVVIENITARNFTENGFFWTGVLGYRGSHLTAYRNGDYGIYSFDSVWGQFDNSYASGSPDAGFYIGQCNPCHALITDVVSEYNQLGYSGTNASGDLFIVKSSWNNNRSGIVPNSLNSELLPPQGHATIAGNAVLDNGSASAATGYEGFDVVFGVGIAVIGAVNDVVTNNRVQGNAKIGIGIAPTPGIGGSFYPSSGNQIRANTVSGSGTADLGIIPAEAAARNCFAGNTFGTSAPSNIELLLPCVGAGVGDPEAGALDLGQFLDTSKNPKGRDYKKTPVPAKQRSMPQAMSAPAAPAGAPAMPVLDAIQIPEAGSTPGR